MRFKPEDDRRKVALYLGLPPDAPLQGFDTDLPPDEPDGDGWRHRKWGIPVNWDVDLDGPPQWPALVMIHSTTGERETYQIWLEQLYHPGLPIAAQRRWHPDLGVKDAIIGLEGHQQPSGKQLIRVRRAFKWLRAREVHEGGRQSGDGEIWESNDESISDINAAIDAGYSTAVAVAHQLLTTARTVQRRVKDATGRPFTAHMLSRRSLSHRTR